MTAKPASTGACSTVLRSRVEPGFGARAGDRDLRLAGDRQRQQLCDPPARQLPARSVVLETDRRREGDAGLAGGWGQVGGRDLDRIDADRERHGLPALEPCQRPDDPRARGLLVESAAGLPGTTSTASPRRTSFASTWRWSIVSREAGELEVERGAVGLHRRRDLGAEEPRLEAAEAADGPEALALAGRGLDRRGPVGLDAERRGLDGVPLAARREDDGNVRDAVEALFEHAARLVRRQAAHVDAGDLRRRRRSVPSSLRTRARRARREPRAARARPAPSGRPAPQSAQAPFRREQMSLQRARSGSV